jgi:two-component system, LuxR family, sensor kinase FixL
MVVGLGATMLCGWPVSPQSFGPAGPAAPVQSLPIWPSPGWHVVGWLVMFVLLAVVVAGFALERGGRRRAESERLAAEQHMRMAASAAGVGLWMRDLARDTSWSNDQCRMILGMGPGEVTDLGKRLEVVHPEDRTRVAAAIDDAIKRGGDYSVRHRIVLPSGDVRWIVSHGSVRLGRDGKAATVWGVTADVTAPVRAELDAEVNRNELAHLSRVAMLGQLSGSIAHELNQPLTAILSNAQAALRFTSAPTVDLEGVREILRDIVADDQRAGEVIWRLRALFERGEAKSEPLVTGTLVRDVVRMLRSDLISRNVNVTLDLDPTLPAIHGDAVQLQQVLLNLIFNACEAMANSERSARALLIRTELSAPAQVAVSVVDGGPGIAPERLQKIFEPFVSSKPLGIGLGLVISRSIVAAHGGRLWCANNEVRGATFTFTIPCEPAPAAADVPDRVTAAALVATKGVLT